MSPKASMSLSARAWLRAGDRPVARLRAAIRQIEAQGLRVVVRQTPGVKPCLHGWCADGKTGEVDPVGAVCLALQPSTAPDPEFAAIEALECGAAWLAGVLDAWNNDLSAVRALGPDRELYLAGLRDGHILFGELTVECDRCGERRHHGEVSCRACEREPARATRN